LPCAYIGAASVVAAAAVAPPSAAFVRNERRSIGYLLPKCFLMLLNRTLLCAPVAED
jgi:hypothetical protein